MMINTILNILSYAIFCILNLTFSAWLILVIAEKVLPDHGTCTGDIGGHIINLASMVFAGIVLFSILIYLYTQFRLITFGFVLAGLVVLYIAEIRFGIRRWSP